MMTKIFLACALGAFVGGLVALSVWQPIWWVGMIVGGFVGYLSYEFKTVIAAIPVAWQEMKDEFSTIFADIAKAWSSKRARARRRSQLRSWTGQMCLFSNFISTLTFFAWGIASPGYEITVPSITALIATGFFGFLACSACGGSMRLRRFLWGERRFNVLFVVFYWIPLGLWRATTATGRGIVQIPGMVMATGQVIARVSAVSRSIARVFIYHLFILVHSEIRLLCAVDAAIGAAVGYLTGHALIGAIAGGLLGVLNYELISKRWLHLVPSDSR